MNDVVNQTIIDNNMKLAKSKKKFLLFNKVNPYRQKDFIALLPFGFGIQLALNIINCLFKNPLHVINDELTENIEYYNKLIRDNNLIKN